MSIQYIDSRSSQYIKNDYRRLGKHSAEHQGVRVTSQKHGLYDFQIFQKTPQHHKTIQKRSHYTTTQSSQKHPKHREKKHKNTPNLLLLLIPILTFTLLIFLPQNTIPPPRIQPLHLPLQRTNPRHLLRPTPPRSLFICRPFGNEAGRRSSSVLIPFGRESRDSSCSGNGAGSNGTTFYGNQKGVGAGGKGRCAVGALLVGISIGLEILEAGAGRWLCMISIHWIQNRRRLERGEFTAARRSNSSTRERIEASGEGASPRRAAAKAAAMARSRRVLSILRDERGEKW